MPFNEVESGVTRAPLWAQLPVSPRILNEMYIIPAPTKIFTLEGKRSPIAYKLTHDGVLRTVEVELAVQFKKNQLREDQMSGIKITTTYPHCKTRTPTSVLVPIEGCLPLFNTLHSMEIQSIQPWMNDRFYPRAHPTTRSLYSWPHGSGKWNQAHILVNVSAENTNDVTDRIVEVQVHYGEVAQQPLGTSGIIPWVLLTPVRLRMESLLQEWRLYTEDEMEVINKIKKVQYQQPENNDYAW
jgi:hypothetical protein